MSPPASEKPDCPAMVGSRCRIPSSPMRRTCVLKNGSGTMTTAPARSRAARWKAGSSSSSRHTSRRSTSSRRLRAAASVSWMRPGISFRGVNRTATRDSVGIASFNTSTRLPLTPVEKRTSPVTLPPGRARLANSPSKGSWAVGTTMGICLVAALAASAASCVPATIRSTGSRTSSPARAGQISGRPRSHRRSRTIVRPSTYPLARSAVRNASSDGRVGGSPGTSTPMRGTLAVPCAAARRGTRSSPASRTWRRFIIDRRPSRRRPPSRGCPGPEANGRTPRRRTPCPPGTAPASADPRQEVPGGMAAPRITRSGGSTGGARRPARPQSTEADPGRADRRSPAPAER